MTGTLEPSGVNEALFGDVAALIERARTRAAARVNSELVMLYWSVGKRVREDVLRGERAEYGAEIVGRLAQRLTARYGRGWGRRNLFRMVRFAAAYPSEEIVSALPTQLTWTNIVEVLTLEDPHKRDFYMAMCAHEPWSMRTLRARIDDKLYERTLAAGASAADLQREIASLRETGTLTPALTFRDPYVLDFLGLPAQHSEADLERAILDEMQRFLVELGAGFAFVGRQKRIVVDGEDYYLDLFFYHVKLRCYVAVDLKTRKLQPGDKGQLELYLAWLDRYERTEGDAPSLGLILCAAKGAEQVELLGLDRGAIRASEYITRDVRAELQRRLEAVSEAES